MKITCGELVGVILLVVSFLASVVALATPYWAGDKVGLLYYCRDDCVWYFMQEDFPDWLKATQVLMVAGFGIGLIAFVVTIVSLNCTYHDCDPHRPIAVLVLFSFFCLTSGIVVYGAKAHDGGMLDYENFHASYWAGVVAAAFALITSGTFCFIDRRNMD